MVENYRQRQSELLRAGLTVNARACLPFYLPLFSPTPFIFFLPLCALLGFTEKSGQSSPIRLARKQPDNFKGSLYGGQHNKHDIIIRCTCKKHDHFAESIYLRIIKI